MRGGRTPARRGTKEGRGRGLKNDKCSWGPSKYKLPRTEMNIGSGVYVCVYIRGLVGGFERVKENGLAANTQFAQLSCLCNNVKIYNRRIRVLKHLTIILI